MKIFTIETKDLRTKDKIIFPIVLIECLIIVMGMKIKRTQNVSYVNLVRRQMNLITRNW